jgi:hypothetical protein
VDRGEIVKVQCATMDRLLDVITEDLETERIDDNLAEQKCA